ncbi:hypothetical protein LX88_002461 [Lentzea californiensis]|nr:hypothetical protein [Lentzea californiensis]
MGFGCRIRWSWPASFWVGGLRPGAVEIWVPHQVRFGGWLRRDRLASTRGRRRSLAVHEAPVGGRGAGPEPSASLLIWCTAPLLSEVVGSAARLVHSGVARLMCWDAAGDGFALPGSARLGLARMPCGRGRWGGDVGTTVDLVHGAAAERGHRLSGEAGVRRRCLTGVSGRRRGRTRAAGQLGVEVGRGALWAGRVSRLAVGFGLVGLMVGGGPSRPVPAGGTGSRPGVCGPGRCPCAGPWPARP